MKTQKTVLLIDDEIDLLEMIQYQLEAKGIKVIAAQDGREALGVLKTVKPHLIILDMNMPAMGGVEFYKNICDNHGKPKYPVLVLTARANMEQFFKDMDVDGFIPKPFEIDHLTKEVEAIIQKTGAEVPSEVVSVAAWKRKMCLIESDPEAFNKLADAFLDSGYMVNSAKTGEAAVARVTADVPDIVLIRLGLSDIPGDVVISRVKDMIQPADVIFVLYKIAGSDREIIRKNIGDGAEVVTLEESDDPKKLLDIVDQECRRRNK